MCLRRVPSAAACKPIALHSVYVRTSKVREPSRGLIDCKAAQTATQQQSAMIDSKKRIGAVLGGIVADGATMGLHWIYDTSKLQQLLQGAGRADQPEFFEPPSCPFYQMPGGALSPYGAELQALLLHMSKHKELQGQSWAQALGDYFSNVYPGYRNHSIKTLIANLAEGKQYPETGDASDFQANCLCKVPAVTAVYAGKPQLAQQLEVAVRAQQNNDAAVAYGVAAGRILEQVIQGSTIEQAVQWAASGANLPADVSKSALEVLNSKDQPFPDAVKQFGSSCAMPGAFKCALLAALTSDSYVEGVRKNMVVGGDNCSRSIYVGALLGAAAGEAAVPGTWRTKLTDAAVIEAAVAELFN